MPMVVSLSCLIVIQSKIYQTRHNIISTTEEFNNKTYMGLD